MRSALLRSLAACFLALLSLAATAQTPSVGWAVSTYGPGAAEAFVGCNGCASDQRNIAVDAQGNVFVSGYTSTTTADDMMVVKYSGATGAVLWQKTFNDANDSFDQAWALALDPTGNAIITGYAWNGTEYDIKTIKYASASGDILWQNTFTGPMSGIDFGIAIGTDAAGNVFVGGNTWNGSNDDAAIIKFAAATGNVIWDKTFAGAAGFNDYFYALAVDGAGNVIVTGEEQLSGVDSNWKTIKYAAADGAILWQASVAGAGSMLDIPFALRVDASNNVVVAGYVTSATFDLDGRVVKYAGSNGAVMWDKTFNGASAGDDIFYSVALDAAGNAIATGFTFSGVAGNDWSTVKYAAADGAVLWARTFGGSGNLSDVSVAVAIDAQGNAIVGGRVNNSADPNNRDMGVVKFAAADGATKWSYAYAGTGGGFDRVAAVATAASGAVFVAGESLETGSPNGWRVIRLDDPAAASFDFNADAKSDLLWQNTDGRAAIWLMNGLAPTTSAEIINAGTGWSVIHVADFNADGKSDLVWQHTDGRVAIYIMDGIAPSTTRQILNAGTPFTVVHTPDLNGDGKKDIVFRNADGGVHGWLMDGDTMTDGAGLFPAGTGWSVSHVADFNGDGNDDLVFTHTDGRVNIRLMNGLATMSSANILGAGTGWSVTHTPDLDGDGKADLVWHNTDGSTAAWLMNGTAMASGTTLLGPGTGWTVTRVGDFDGDGKADVFFLHTDGRAAIWLMNGLTPATQAQILNAGGGWSAKRVQDLDGDGKSDIVWQNTNGSVAVWLMNGTAMASGQGILGTGTGWSVSGVSQ